METAKGAGGGGTFTFTTGKMVVLLKTVKISLTSSTGYPLEKLKDIYTNQLNNFLKGGNKWVQLYHAQ